MKIFLKFAFRFLLVLSTSIILVYLFYTVRWKINTYNNNSILGEKAPKIEFEGKMQDVMMVSTRATFKYAYYEIS